jgi:hypothetical protein
MASESLQLVQKIGAKASKEDKKYQKGFDEYTKLAEIYQAYNQVNKFVEESYQQVI